jgi:hypothetical protein
MVIAANLSTNYKPLEYTRQALSLEMLSTLVELLVPIDFHHAFQTKNNAQV